ncbi:MAG: hypothetical protein ACYYKD_01850 [Rhodospirillales bacterium]
MPNARALFSMLANPYPPADVSPANFISPPDVEIGDSGFDMTEALFAENRRLIKQGAALAEFFGDERGHIALKKAVHVVMEQRLRILGFRAEPPFRHGFSDRVVIPEGVHPLDELLSGAAAGLKGRLRLYAAVLARALHLTGTAALIGWRFGRNGLTPKRGAIGAPSQVFTRDWGAFRQAAVDSGVWREDGVVLITEHGKAAKGAPEWCSHLRCPELPVEPSAWRRRVSRPARKFAWKTVKLAAAGFSDVWALQGAYESLALARDSLIWRRVAANVCFDWVVNVEEYSPKHIVKAMVLNADGTRLAHWPHSVMEMAGAAVSYLCYDVYFSSGPYPVRCYSRTWGDVSETTPVGLFRNDRRMLGGALPDAVWDKMIQGHLAAKRRMLVYFLPNAFAGFERVIEDTLRTAIPILAERPDWFLVIKPKGRKSSSVMDDVLRRNADIRRNLSETGALTVRVANEKHDPCPTSWLLDRMDAAIGMNSIQIEGVCLGAPVICYWPIHRISPLHQKYRDMGLIFDDLNAFAVGLGRILDGAADVNWDWFREALDPFSDGDALGRLARRLLGGSVAPRMASKTELETTD